MHTVTTQCTLLWHMNTVTAQCTLEYQTNEVVFRPRKEIQTLVSSQKLLFNRMLVKIILGGTRDGDELRARNFLFAIRDL